MTALPQCQSCLHVKAWHSLPDARCAPSVGLCGCEGYVPPEPSPEGPGAVVSTAVEYVDTSLPPAFTVDVDVTGDRL